MKYYLDTCIWFDYFENRQDKYRPLGEWAIKLINKIIAEESTFIFTDILMRELKTRYSQKQLTSYLEIIPKSLIIYLRHSYLDIAEAITLKEKLNISFGDALHAILARNNDAMLITRDNHFNEIKFIKIFKPEDLI
ncbi:MAG: PIN domain-containing protein [Candidatus Nanoarchaeia archaeon]|nr:PIN domain-containing protein [Candidatus Nanoarchaeia archaeon]